MKKLMSILTAAVLAFSFTACKKKGQNEGEIEGIVHTSHQATKVLAKAPTCQQEGNIEYWSCFGCDKIYQDAEMTTELSRESIVLPKEAHAIVPMSANASTCTKKGNAAYYYCPNCFTYFSDENGQTGLADKGKVQLPTIAHQMSHQDAVAPGILKSENGNVEFWQCTVCEGYYLDSEGKKMVTEEETVLLSAYNIPDFVVEVAENKNPVVLQLTDTQIIDAGQMRFSNRLNGTEQKFWATDKAQDRCYAYLTEIITATTPDLILLTGDIVYGEFDDNGTALLALIEFMESFQIPWAPIFGNHEAESKKGADWQCEQLEKATYCLFEQKNLTGNGNYSVGIAQGGVVKRVFYMLDSNGSGAASEESLANGHTKTSVGFGQDQIDWYTQEITALKGLLPEVKVSFAYHIQGAIFGTAYAKYGFNQENQAQDINIDRFSDKAASDFGYIGSRMKNPWDENFTVFNGMKSLGADSIFVGHEHCNSASVVYDGVRFQFGQKSSEYDRFNYVNADGSITTNDANGGKSLMGGTVIPLSATDGSIVKPYIYYCGYPNGQLDWTQFN